MVRKAAGIGFHGGVPDQVGWVGDVQLAGPAEHARHHWHQEPGHANVVPLGGSALAAPDEQHRAAGRRQPGLELAATRTVRPDSHATHSVMVIPAVN
jgi:hypothetical protein